MSKMDSTREVAKYLASEISKSDFMDLKELESKIFACLAVMAPIKGNGKTSQLESKLATVKAESKMNNTRYSLQVKFWKNKVRQLVEEKVLEGYFNEVDEIMKKNGCY